MTELFMSVLDNNIYHLLNFQKTAHQSKTYVDLSLKMYRPILIFFNLYNCKL